MKFTASPESSRVFIEVTAEPIELSKVDWEKLRGPGEGACNLFTGSVRNRNHGREVSSVAYDAFIPLAGKVLREIAVEALKRHGGHGSVLVQHRIGTLGVGEISVLIAANTPHRAEAFAICREVIEELKVRAPIWKKETYTDGETGWLRGHALCSHGRGESTDA